MPSEAENTKSEVSRWESKVSTQTCMYFVRLARIVFFLLGDAPASECYVPTFLLVCMTYEDGTDRVF